MRLITGPTLLPNHSTSRLCHLLPTRPRHQPEVHRPPTAAATWPGAPWWPNTGTAPPMSSTRRSPRCQTSTTSPTERTLRRRWRRRAKWRPPAARWWPRGRPSCSRSLEHRRSRRWRHSRRHRRRRPPGTCLGRPWPPPSRWTAFWGKAACRETTSCPRRRRPPCRSRPPSWNWTCRPQARSSCSRSSLCRRTTTTWRGRPRARARRGTTRPGKLGRAKRSNRATNPAKAGLRNSTRCRNPDSRTESRRCQEVPGAGAAVQRAAPKLTSPPRTWPWREICPGAAAGATVACKEGPGVVQPTPWWWPCDANEGSGQDR